MGHEWTPLPSSAVILWSLYHAHTPRSILGVEHAGDGHLFAVTGPPPSSCSVTFSNWVWVGDCRVTLPIGAARGNSDRLPAVTRAGTPVRENGTPGQWDFGAPVPSCVPVGRFAGRLPGIQFG